MAVACKATVSMSKRDAARKFRAAFFLPRHFFVAKASYKCELQKRVAKASGKYNCPLAAILLSRRVTLFRRSLANFLKGATFVFHSSVACGWGRDGEKDPCVGHSHLRAHSARKHSQGHIGEGASVHELPFPRDVDQLLGKSGHETGRRPPSSTTKTPAASSW